MSGAINHRHHSTLPAGTGDVRSTEWNDSLVVSGGSNGQYMRRNSVATDGWDFANIDLTSEVSGLLPRANADTTLRNPDIRAAFTTPINADFSWVNQGSASVRDDGDSVVLTGSATGSGTNLQMRTHAAPVSTPWTVTAYMVPMFMHKAFNGYGLFFRNAAAGTIASLSIHGSDLGLTTYDVLSAKFNSPTSFSANYAGFAQKTATAYRWFRIQDTGANRVVSLSADGVDWLQVHSVGRTDFLTADQWGFYVSSENSATPNYAPILRVYHIAIT